MHNKILWLASYPKSGNTWFRVFISALFNGNDIDINDLNTTGIFSSRQLFEMTTDLDPFYLYKSEIQNMMPDVFRALAQNRKGLSTIKVHDAYSYNSEHQPIIPGDVTHCAVYIIRNPLDVVSSLANHLRMTTDEAINMMNSDNAYMGSKPEKINIFTQFSQLLRSWSNHVLSWQEQPDFPVFFIRYEDMHERPFDTFSNVVKQIGFDCTDEAIRQAIEASSFNKLKEQEQKNGFKERPYKDNSFFRKGATGSWKSELTDEQAKKITDAHAPVMKKFNYI